MSATADSAPSSCMSTLPPLNSQCRRALFHAVPCIPCNTQPDRTRQLDALQTAYLHHADPPAFPAHQYRRPFLLHPEPQTNGRRLPSPLRRPRSSLAFVHTASRLGVNLSSATLRYSSPRRPLLIRHMPPRRPLLRRRNIRRQRTPAYSIFFVLNRPRVRRPSGHLFFCASTKAALGGSLLGPHLSLA